MPAPQDFGKQLRDDRDRAGLTQADLAARVGVTLQAVQRWEGPHPSTPRRPNVITAARVVGMDVDAALAMAGYPPQSDDERAAGHDPLKAEVDQMWPELGPMEREVARNVVRTLHRRRPGYREGNEFTMLLMVRTVPSGVAVTARERVGD